MTLRIVAADRPRMCRRATAREPTGSAVCTYSAITAISTSRLRRSRGGTLIVPPYATPLQQFDKERIGEKEARFGETEATGVLDQEFARLPVLQQSGQPPALERDALVDPGGRHTIGGAQAQHESLGQSLSSRQDLVAANRIPAVLH